MFVLLFALIFGVILFQIYQFGKRDLAQRAPIAIVMGAAEYGGVPSDVLKARLDHAIMLFREHLVPTIMTTGGSEHGDSFTEAQVSELYLVSKGVPNSDIVVDAVGNDTYQSLVSVNAKLVNMGIRTAIFVSDPFHEFRVAQIVSPMGIVDIPSATHTSPIRGWTAITYYLREGVAVLAAKVVGYKFLSVIRHGS